MIKTKKELMKEYSKTGTLGAAQRENLFLSLQDIKEIPEHLEFSDENYAEYVGVPFAAMPSPEVANEYLKNVFNKLSLIDFVTIAGDRVELFNRGLKPYVPYGDTAELIYTNLRETSGYDVSKFVPDQLVGGDEVYSQRISLDNEKDPTKNQDRRILDVVVPTLIISQALNGAIQTGLANGWPTIFDEQMARSWDMWKFNRLRNLLALAGGTPDSNMWLNQATKFTANDAQFVEITSPVTDAQTFQDFLVQIYGVSAELEGQYHNEYNPANIYQINPLSEQSLFLDSGYEPYWRVTDAVIYNSQIINVKNLYKSVDFLKLIASKVKTEAVKVKAILYVGNPFLHYPFTDGTYRGTQLWERNRTTSIYDHLWVASGIDLSKPVIVFYEKSA